jgi:pimeloyl-ACP methyl ester carboxylesterase
VSDVRAFDGRNLRVYDDGDPSGTPVIVHHGTPATGQFFAPHVEDASRRGIRLIGYDRPGLGHSTPRPGRVVGDSVDDVAAVADALEVERFATWGVSGGGPHALACAALMPERVIAAASLAAYAPIDAEGLDWTGGMGDFNLEGFAAIRAGPVAHEDYVRREAEQLRTVEAAEVHDYMASLLTQVDRAVLTHELAEYLASIYRDAVLESIEGWRDDDLEGDRSWGFRLDDIQVPVLLWHGRHDLFVPFAHGEWLAKHIPGVDARLSEEDGHLTLFVRRIPEVHDWLLTVGSGSEGQRPRSAAATAPSDEPNV